MEQDRVASTHASLAQNDLEQMSGDSPDTNDIVRRHSHQRKF